MTAANQCSPDAYRPRCVPSRLSALADATRLAIFERLATNGPLSVGDLARAFPVSRPAISQHLRVLKDAGLVVNWAVGTRRFYALDPNGVAALSAFFDRCRVLANAANPDHDVEGTFS